MEVGGGGGRDDDARVERQQKVNWATRPQTTWGEFAIKALAVIATRPSVRPGMTSAVAQVYIQCLSFEMYLLERASAVRTSSPRSTGSQLRCASTTAAKALTARLKRIWLERLDVNAKITNADDGQCVLAIVPSVVKRSSQSSTHITNCIRLSPVADTFTSC